MRVFETGKKIKIQYQAERILATTLYANVLCYYDTWLQYCEHAIFSHWTHWNPFGHENAITITRAIKQQRLPAGM